jgi:hypothetical protein
MCFITTVRTIICTHTVVSATFIFNFPTHISLSQFLFQYVQLNVINLQATNYILNIQIPVQGDCPI